MYGREYGDRDLMFEASGGLLHAALVMQDKETDSYWSIMTGQSLSGEFKGTALDELPLGVKTQWKDWVSAHPDTLVLSIDGKEHLENNPYDNYVTSDRGYRNLEANDDRLPTKTSVFSFKLADQAFAVPFEAFEGGRAFTAGDSTVFLFRPPDVAVYYSTVAFRVTDGRFKKRRGVWRHLPSDATFDPETGTFSGGEGPVERLDGFDTFWYMWSLSNPETAVLRK